MNADDGVTIFDMVSCEYCGEQVGRGRAATYTPKGAEYVVYFCDLACLQEWRQELSERD